MKSIKRNTHHLLWCAVAFLSLSHTSTPLLASSHSIPKTDFPESFTQIKSAQGINAAWYDGATSRYAHGVLGDAIESSELHVTTASGKKLSLKLDSQQVFEDIITRLADIDGDGKNEVITIRSHQNKGAQIAIYGITKTQPDRLSLIASTPYIGKPYRWLAPIGIADFNRDGNMDIAYIDRPHLAKRLRVWSYSPTGLTQIAQQSGLTNHRIGDDFITGGVQRCGKETAMITLNSDWTRVMKTYFENDQLVSEDIGPYIASISTDPTLSCQ